jgi:glycosyltransferase involved in cell wall biosynthesis
MKKPFLSICVVTLNDRENLIRTLHSIEPSNEIEVIIQDGKSDYDVIQVLEQFPLLYASIKVKIENDIGIYDAMNRAAARSIGDFVMFLNCGDRIEKKMQPILLASLKRLNTKFNCVKFLANVSGEGIRIERASKLYFFKHMLNHQSIIYRRSVLSAYKFDSNLKITADLKHFLESGLMGSIAYVDLVLIDYMNGGLAAINTGIRQNWKERSKSWQWNIGILQRVILMLAVFIRYFLFIFRLK